VAPCHSAAVISNDHASVMELFHGDLGWIELAGNSTNAVADNMARRSGRGKRARE